MGIFLAGVFLGTFFGDFVVCLGEDIFPINGKDDHLLEMCLMSCQVIQQGAPNNQSLRYYMALNT